tara:strand:- start:31 stop:1050 length:1020 start_codon:yes stop_codon:yes gene_type:complete
MKSHFLNPAHEVFKFTSLDQVQTLDSWQRVNGHADWVGAENLIINVDVADVDDFDPSSIAVEVRASSGDAVVEVVYLEGQKAFSSKQVQAVIPISSTNGFDWRVSKVTGAKPKLCSIKIVGYVGEFDADRFTYGSKISQLPASEEIKKDDLFIISRNSSGAGGYDASGRPVGARVYDESKSVNLYDLRQSLGLGAFAKIGNAGSQDGPYLNCTVLETEEGVFKLTTSGGLFPEQKAIVLASSSGTNGALNGGHIEVGDPKYVATTIGFGPQAKASFDVEVIVKQWGIPLTPHYAVTAAGGDDRKDEWHTGFNDFARMGEAQTYQPTVLCIAVLGVPPSE